MCTSGSVLFMENLCPLSSNQTYAYAQRSTLTRKQLFEYRTRRICLDLTRDQLTGILMVVTHTQITHFDVQMLQAADLAAFHNRITSLIISTNYPARPSSSVNPSLTASDSQLLLVFLPVQNQLLPMVDITTDLLNLKGRRGVKACVFGTGLFRDPCPTRVSCVPQYG